MLHVDWTLQHWICQLHTLKLHIGLFKVRLGERRKPWRTRWKHFITSSSTRHVLNHVFVVFPLPRTIWEPGTNKLSLTFLRQWCTRTHTLPSVRTHTSHRAGWLHLDRNRLTASAIAEHCERKTDFSCTFLFHNNAQVMGVSKTQ